MRATQFSIFERFDDVTVSYIIVHELGDLPAQSPCTMSTSLQHTHTYSYDDWRALAFELTQKACSLIEIYYGCHSRERFE